MIRSHYLAQRRPILQDILRKLGRDEVPMVSEILDPRTKQLVALSGCSDYVVSGLLRIITL